MICSFYTHPDSRSVRDRQKGIKATSFNPSTSDPWETRPHPNYDDYVKNVDKSFSEVFTWLSNNLLSINHNKTTYLQFRTMNSPKLDYNTLETSNYIANDSSTKFLGTIIDEKLTWYDQINQILKRLSSACFAFRISTPLLPDETVRQIYFAYVQSILTYGIIFWGNSTHAT